MFDIQNNLLQSDNFSDIYERYLDKRDKIKKEWTLKPPQSYVGDVFHGNIHRHGFYFVDNENKLFYDGLFYANNLEGYAQVFYNDGSNFQGLFRDNLRFGPGIYTYPNGEQDVGLWNGHRLLRLGGLNDNNLVPRLAVTPSGQLKLLKFRYLVPVCPKNNDIAYTILEELGASEEVLKKSYKLYNIEVQNKRNIFFNKNLFNKHIGIDQDCTIDIVSSDEEEVTNDDDTETEEQKEETPGGCSDINVERVRDISEELEFIESRLQVVKKQKAIMEKNVEYCRACCSQEHREEEEEEAGQEEEQQEEEQEEGGYGELTLPRKEKESLEQPEIGNTTSLDIFAIIRASMEETDAFLQKGERKVSQKSFSMTSDATWSFGKCHYLPRGEPLMQKCTP